MTFSFTVRGNDEVTTRALARELLCPAEAEAVRLALTAEHLRTLIYMASAREDASAAARLVHTRHLMASLRRSLDGLWAHGSPSGPRAAPLGSPDDRYRLALDGLAEIGDVINVGGGFWISAPLRLIEFPESDMLLVLGGVPSEIVQSAVNAKPVCAGLSRFVPRSLLKTDRRNARLIQPFSAWLGITESLSAWTQDTIAMYLRRLSSTQDITVEQLEIYGPDVLESQRKVGRWIPALQVSQSLPGPRVFRPGLAWAREYNRPYYLGLFDFRRGELILRQSTALDFEITRRLRFGFDELLNVPRGASLTVAKDACLLDLRYPLPQPESRVLALGWKTHPEDAELRHLSTFHPAAMPALTMALRQLSVTATLVHRSH